MPQALPYLAGAALVANTVNALRPAPKPPSPPPTLSWEEAMQRAQQTLNPLFDQALQERLKQVAENQMRRGFFGQLPGAAMSQDAAARLEAERASQIANLANQLTTMSAQEATRQQAIAAEFMLNNLAAQRAMGQQFGNLMNVISTMAQTWPTVFRFPNTAETLSAGRQALTNTPGIANPFTLPSGFQGVNLAGLLSSFGASSFTNPY